jgi:hypothetical protein
VLQAMREENLFTPVFILGVQRAGTTLINKLLSKNNQLKIFERETHLYILLWNIRNSLPFSNNRKLANYLFLNLPKINNGWTHADSLPILKELTDLLADSDKSITSVDDLMEFFLLYWQNRHPQKLVGEKTPGHIFYLSLLIKKFPYARFIIMIRDPRACYLSENTKLKNAQAKPLSIMTFITRWASVSFLARYYQKKYPKQVQVYKYEDLILHPQETIMHACDFLKIDFSEKMLEAKVTNSSFQDGKQQDKTFNQENIDRWKEMLTPNEIILIESTLSSELKHWKYSFSALRKTKPPELLKVIVLKVIIGISNLTCRLNAPFFHHINRNKRYKNLKK